MGQGEVLKYLESTNDWTTIIQMVENLDYNRSSISESLRKLIKDGYVEVRIGKSSQTLIVHEDNTPRR